MSFNLPDLPYDFSALEPHIDARTMEIHHGKHHAGYVNNLNNAISGNVGLEDKSLDELIGALSAVPSEIQTAVRNNGGGHWNHSFFWKIMSGNGGGRPEGDLAKAMDDAFGSFDAFAEAFKKAGATRFGSGWAWLVLDAGGNLKVGSTANQDNPLMDISDFKGTPILGVDVWEHAYYLNYQNRRPDYLNAFFNVINWEAVSENFKNAL
ncbi:MAG TPA: superoxide dismutase [Caldithrix abyssi]|uniref:Superoxide dismutase n=1 Tax=Caldithrix abyssi TaxID=187145 RepID=A0A7V5RQ09_CALAY|nr:superoxide dismutase [Caldithrix abyssi]